MTRVPRLLGMVGFSMSLAVFCGCASMEAKADSSESTKPVLSSTEAEELTGQEINAVLRTASIFVKDWDASIKFYSEFLGYDILVEQPIKDAKSLKTIGARPDSTARIAYLKPVNSRIDRPFTGNYLSLIELSGPEGSMSSYEREENEAFAIRGEVTLAHQVVEIDRVYDLMRSEGITIIAPLSLSGTGQSRSFSVIDPNGIRVEMYEYVAGKEPENNP